MKILLAALLLLPATARAHVPICAFTPEARAAGTSCAPVEITIDTHHGPDTPHFAYGGTTAPITAIPDETVPAPNSVTPGHGDRDIVTLFNGVGAIHTRHVTLDGRPATISAPGRRTSLS